ncbi:MULTISPECIES: hypothetical protein [unclassified Staphylococcus]|uniref:hypothetical protein n=1 Tax=unclassified Staphylococcus TaxID=91994 RepID=UPI0021D28AB4|nr:MULTISPECIES: hypothetical protein [unclassified Staphylococcus]UXR73325.1 hypothetical protein MUA48_08065 [Staphylococcus sp. IVB6238]UXR75632.1 hypothetical protein MUA74_08150 [Staphylococcus sp. IVB6233]
MTKCLALLIAMMTTLVVTTPFAFEAYLTTTLFVAMWTMIISYYITKYVIKALKKTDC